MEDTISAISTALGIGAISIIRTSGPQAITIVNKIFDKDILTVPSHTIHYGHIVDKKEIIDEVLVSVMRSPKTYTKEDIVEINCHGSISSTNSILKLLLANGSRLAEPGEFTKRAFLNGRIDLTQAQGVMNLISSKTEMARKLSINQLTGHVSQLIESLRSDLMDIISNILVNIDYPEYEDITELTNQKVLPKLKKILLKITEIIQKSEDGRVINEGINIGIIGRPNVGKSSLLNTLLEEDKAIVTDIEGTTRDLIEGQFILHGLICNVIDTAGIRKTKDYIEQLGVDKSYQIIDKSDLIIFLLNNNEVLTTEDKNILKKIKNKKHIIVINKTDLPNKLTIDTPNIIKMSLKEHTGVESLKNRIAEMFNLEELKTQDLTYLSNAFSIIRLKKAKDIIQECLANISKYPIDIIEFDLRKSWLLLGEIIGKTYQEELLDEIFSRFCLGK